MRMVRYITPELHIEPSLLPAVTIEQVCSTAWLGPAFPSNGELGILREGCCVPGSVVSVRLLSKSEIVSVPRQLLSY